MDPTVLRGLDAVHGTGDLCFSRSRSSIVSMSQTEENDPQHRPGTGSSPWAAHRDHPALWSELTRREAALVDAVAAHEGPEPARRALVEFLRSDVATHLRNEELVLYGTARDVGESALAAALELDHRTLLALTDRIEQAATGFDAALSARSLLTLFFLRTEKEETVLLPALRRAGVDVSVLTTVPAQMMGDDSD